MTDRAPRYVNPIPAVRADLSDVTRQGLKAWLDWVEAGCPDDFDFKRWRGLCKALQCWAANRHRRWDWLDYITADLLEAFDGEDYPFGGPKRYYWEGGLERMHKNKHRLAWVRANLPEED